METGQKDVLPIFTTDEREYAKDRGCEAIVKAELNIGKDMSSLKGIGLVLKSQDL